MRSHQPAAQDVIITDLQNLVKFINDKLSNFGTSQRRIKHIAMMSTNLLFSTVYSVGVWFQGTYNKSCQIE
jgi:hypothetical protein